MPPHTVLTRILAQGDRYIRNLTWLVRNSLRTSPRHWYRVIAATILNLVSNALVIGAVFAYVRLLERDASITIGGQLLSARSSPTLLALFAAFVLLCLLTFAASSYIARTTSLRMARGFQEAYLAETLRALRRLPAPGAERAGEIALTLAHKRLAFDLPRQCGWATRVIANAVPGLFTFCFAYIGLWILDAPTTLLVTALGLAVIAAQYPSNLGAAAASNRVDETRAALASALNALVTDVNRSGIVGSAAAMDRRIQLFFASPNVREHLDANENRFRSLELSALAMQSGGALVLAAMLLTIGYDLLRNGGDWARLIAYASLLRVLLGSATGVSRAVTAFSRLSPYVQTLREFILSANAAMPPVPGPARARRILLAAKGLDGASSQLDLDPGMVVAVWNREGAGRELALVMQRALAPASQAEGETLPSCELLPNPVAGIDGTEVVERLLEAARQRSADLLLVDRAVVASLDASRWDYWRSIFNDRSIGIVYAMGDSIPMGYGESRLVVRGGSELRWANLEGIAASPTQFAAWRSLMAVPRPAGIATVEDDELES